MKNSLLSGAESLAAAETLTTAERKFAIDHFYQTKARFEKDVKGLSAAQLSFKADSSCWTIAQCIEHIAIAESSVWQWARGTMQQPAAPEKRSEVKFTTGQLVAATENRSGKFPASEVLQPTGRFPDSQTAILVFTRHRDSIMEYINTTKDNLKVHFVTHPAFGVLDIYQILVFASAHCARHILQIEEVMASHGFPKHQG